MNDATPSSFIQSDATPLYAVCIKAARAADGEVVDEWTHPVYGQPPQRVIVVVRDSLGFTYE